MSGTLAPLVLRRQRSPWAGTNPAGPGWGQHGDMGALRESERSSRRARGTEAGGDTERSHREHRAGSRQPVLTRGASSEAGAEGGERERSQRAGDPALEAEMGRVTPGRGAEPEQGRAAAAGRGMGRRRGQGGDGGAELLWVGRTQHPWPAGRERAREVAQDARVARDTAQPRRGRGPAGRATGQPARRTWHVPRTRWHRARQSTAWHAPWAGLCMARGTAHTVPGWFTARGMAAQHTPCQDGASAARSKQQHLGRPVPAERGAHGAQRRDVALRLAARQVRTVGRSGGQSERGCWRRGRAGRWGAADPRWTCSRRAASPARRPRRLPGPQNPTWVGHTGGGGGGWGGAGGGTWLRRGAAQPPRQSAEAGGGWAAAGQGEAQGWPWDPQPQLLAGGAEQPLSLSTPRQAGPLVPVRGCTVLAARNRGDPSHPRSPSTTRAPPSTPAPPPAPYSHDGALGEGQVVHQHVQSLVLIVEELAHPPTAPGTRQVPWEPGIPPPRHDAPPPAVGIHSPAQGWGEGTGPSRGSGGSCSPAAIAGASAGAVYLPAAGRGGLGPGRQAGSRAGCWGCAPVPSPGQPGVGGFGVPRPPPGRVLGCTSEALHRGRRPAKTCPGAGGAMGRGSPFGGGYPGVQRGEHGQRGSVHGMCMGGGLHMGGACTGRGAGCTGGVHGGGARPERAAPLPPRSAGWARTTSQPPRLPVPLPAALPAAGGAAAGDGGGAGGAAAAPFLPAPAPRPSPFPVSGCCYFQAAGGEEPHGAATAGPVAGHSPARARAAPSTRARARSRAPTRDVPTAPGNVPLPPAGPRSSRPSAPHAGGTSRPRGVGEPLAPGWC